MSAIRKDVQRKLFQTDDERLQSIVHAVKTDGKKKKRPTFFCLAVTIEHPISVRLYFVKGDRDDVYKKKDKFHLREVREVDGINPKKSLPDFHITIGDRKFLMDKFAGYYGQALQFFVFAVSCVFSPSFVRYFSSKGSPCILAGIFSLFFLGYVHINQHYFYFSQGLVGFGYALFNNAEGAYIVEHSTLETLENNFALETGIGHGGQLLSGITLWAVSQYYIGDQLEIDYSERHILMLYIPAHFGDVTLPILGPACASP